VLGSASALMSGTARPLVLMRSVTPFWYDGCGNSRLTPPPPPPLKVPGRSLARVPERENVVANRSVGASSGLLILSRPVCQPTSKSRFQPALFKALVGSSRP